MNKDTNGKGFEYTSLRKEMFDIMFYRTDGRAHGDLSIEEQIDEILDRIKSYLLENGPKEEKINNKLEKDVMYTPEELMKFIVVNSIKSGKNSALQSYKDFIKDL